MAINFSTTELSKARTASKQQENFYVSAAPAHILDGYVWRARSSGHVYEFDNKPEEEKKID